MSATTCAAAALSTTSTMPIIGLGTYLMDRESVVKALPAALEAGYRRIDCAPVYFNEDAIGKVLHDVTQEQLQSGDGLVIRREDLYVASKLASPFHQRKHVEVALRKTLLDLQLDYLDLYLVHWPVAFHYVEIDPTKRGWDNEDIDDSDGGKNIDPNVSLVETWLGMQDMVEKGLTKQIGVSNVPVALLHELLASKPKILPFINQVELHPYLPQTNLVNYCLERGIGVQAYSPLGTPEYKEQGEPTLMEEPVLKQIAARHGVSVARVCLKWALQRNTSVVVKSKSPQHLRENMDLNFTLTEQDMEHIASLSRNHRFFRPEDWWGPMGAVFE